jgi:hypothetical protein
MPSSIGERMGSVLARGAILDAVAAVASIAIAACTTSTEDNFTNPPPGPPASCTAIPAQAGCIEGALSFSCASDRPDDGDSDLVCDRGSPGLGAATVYCCAPYGQWATLCTPNPTVPGCGGEALGFSCAGPATPDEVDPSLVCSGAIAADGGGADYCCVSADQAAPFCRCASFDEDAGLCGAGAESTCAGGSIGFTCTGGHTPVEVNPILHCARPDGGAAGAFCCETP